MKYKFKYKRIGNWFWTTKTVTGHGVEDNRLILYFKDLTLLEIPKFDELEVRLGNDWLLSTKASMEKEAGNAVKVELNTQAT